MRFSKRRRVGLQCGTGWRDHSAELLRRLVWGKTESKEEEQVKKYCERVEPSYWLCWVRVSTTEV